MSYMIGVDVGGTFTDFSLFDTESGALRHYKRSSTPEDPSKAIMGGIQEILAEQKIDPAQGQKGRKHRYAVPCDLLFSQRNLPIFLFNRIIRIIQ